MQEAFSGTVVLAEKSIRLLIATFLRGFKTSICSDCRSESAKDRTDHSLLACECCNVTADYVSSRVCQAAQRCSGDEVRRLRAAPPLFLILEAGPGEESARPFE